MYIKQRKIPECTDVKLNHNIQKYMYMYTPKDSAVEELQVNQMLCHRIKMS